MTERFATTGTNSGSVAVRRVTQYASDLGVALLEASNETRGVLGSRIELTSRTRLFDIIRTSASRLSSTAEFGRVTRTRRTADAVGHNVAWHGVTALAPVSESNGSNLVVSSLAVIRANGRGHERARVGDRSDLVVPIRGTSDIAFGLAYGCDGHAFRLVHVVVVGSTTCLGRVSSTVRGTVGVWTSIRGERVSTSAAITRPRTSVSVAKGSTSSSAGLSGHVGRSVVVVIERRVGVTSDPSSSLVGRGTRRLGVKYSSSIGSATRFGRVS